MRIEETQITKIKITDLDACDPITLLVEDIEHGEGKLIIECSGRSWSSHWTSMGKSLLELLDSESVDYLANRLWDHNLPQTEPDYSLVTDSIRSQVLELRREGLIDNHFAREIYNIKDWQSYGPQHT